MLVPQLARGAVGDRSTGGGGLRFEGGEGLARVVALVHGEFPAEGVQLAPGRGLGVADVAPGQVVDDHDAGVRPDGLPQVEVVRRRAQLVDGHVEGVEALAAGPPAPVMDAALPQNGGGGHEEVVDERLHVTRRPQPADELHDGVGHARPDGRSGVHIATRSRSVGSAAAGVAATAFS